ncbi:MAG: alanine--tRNA ligase [Prevotellaceae bacterium]|jgi:alanyl-tRNA synthetase|nr:alanine--tRNA ligase [Prevotellaceae bacterium]
MDSKQVRETFLEFFKSKGHEIVPSAPMVVKNDPTLMFTNAGMNQFKDIFLGNTPAKFKRIADTQKCLRVSGKHNDLEEVGYDTYHHTMFEMLGNWSFGDYFKKEAIEWAWELLVAIYKLKPGHLYATIFEGSEEDGVERDNEAFECWKQFLPENRILLGNKKDNFWEMGEVGPCGPCSEIHIDLRDDDERAKIDGASLVNKGNPLVIEIWNLVFIQYNRKADKSLELLPAKHVDTGMGFERLCMALQAKKSNYDTDIFQPVINKIAELSGKKYGENTQTDVAMRVIADHLRAISFSIADGQLPSNVKAGYVIRRILRRAVRYGYTFLNFDEPVIYKFVPTLINEMGDAFPELKAQQTLIERVIFEEENSFLHTLANGIRLLDSIIEKKKSKSETLIDGKSAFVLFDTYGFPIDLTELIAAEEGMKVDFKEFDKELTKQKKRSQNASTIETDDWVELKPVTQTLFVGYDYNDYDIEITRYRTVKTKGKTLYQLVFDKTPFYAESGGQVGDSGYIESADEQINIINTLKENNLIIHVAEKLPENPSSGFHAHISLKNRLATENNHTATHLMHYALRKVLGTHVEQKGSFVGPNYLRFDFSHFQKVNNEEIEQVERIVNKLIRANISRTELREVSMEKAKGMGAMALFGEKYGDSVRVIRFGDSVELCGGTHAASTGQIGFFKILSEGAVSAGVRRIEAVTGEKAENVIYEWIGMLKQVKSIFNNTPSLLQAIKKTIEENSEFRKQLEDMITQRVMEVKKELIETAEEINGVKVIPFVMDLQISPDMMKDLAYQLRRELPDLIFAAGNIYDGKPTLTLMLSDSVVAQGKNAAAIIHKAAKLINGGGGGQSFYATAGGKNTEGIDAAVAKIIELATS